MTWYAKRLRVRPDQVRALQRDSVGPSKVKVLVLAQAGGGRLDSALVTVTRRGGRWVVP